MIEIPKRRHPYQWRTRLRQHLPALLINLGFARKGFDCESVGAQHSWYNIDGVTSGCYHCRAVRTGRLWDEAWEFPDGWNKTRKELFEGLERGQAISGEELAWASAYERSLLRTWARFPHDADIYEALDDFDIEFMIDYKAPGSTDGKGTLRKGTRIRVSVDAIEPISATGVLLNDDSFEARYVPEQTRSNPKYQGIILLINTEDLNRRFRLAGPPAHGAV